MSWQKDLNDMSKRHHIRIWKQPQMWDGQEVWAAAATRDIDFAYMHHGRAMTHRIDENIDRERDKIAYDLAFTSYVDVLDWEERSTLPSVTRNGTGDLMNTDKRIAVLRLRDSRNAAAFDRYRGDWTRFRFMAAWASASCGVKS